MVRRQLDSARNLATECATCVGDWLRAIWHQETAVLPTGALLLAQASLRYVPLMLAEKAPPRLVALTRGAALRAP